MIVSCFFLIFSPPTPGGQVLQFLEKAQWQHSEGQEQCRVQWVVRQLQHLKQFLDNCLWNGKTLKMEGRWREKKNMNDHYRTLLEIKEKIRS